MREKVEKSTAMVVQPEVTVAKTRDDIKKNLDRYCKLIDFGVGYFYERPVRLMIFPEYFLQGVTTPGKGEDGLEEFMLSLLDEWEGRIRVSAYPNPFQSDVVFEASSLSGDSQCLEVAVFDVRGRKLRDLFVSASGPAHLVWDGRDRRGRIVSSGVYFASVRAGGELHIRKLIKR